MAGGRLLSYWEVGRLLSYWEGHFSGAMLNFQGVRTFFWKRFRCQKKVGVPNRREFIAIICPDDIYFTVKNRMSVSEFSCHVGMLVRPLFVGRWFGGSNHVLRHIETYVYTVKLYIYNEVVICIYTIKINHRTYIQVHFEKQLPVVNTISLSASFFQRNRPSNNIFFSCEA